MAERRYPPESAREKGTCRHCYQPVWIVYHGPRSNHTIEGRAVKQRDEELRERLKQARRRLESQSIHMPDPAFARTPVSAFDEFRTDLDSIFEEGEDD